VSPEDGPSVKVTLETIYHEVLKLTGLPDRVNDHEIRLRAIEKYMWIWIGSSAILGAGLGQIVNAVINGGG